MMKYGELINEWRDICLSNNHHDYNYILTDNFIFTTPLREIKGKVNFINTEINRNHLVAVNTTLLHLFENCDKNTYYLIDELHFMEKKDYTIITHQTISVENNLISNVKMSVNNLSDELISIIK